MTGKYDHRNTYAIRMIIGLILLVLFIIDGWMVTTGKTQAVDDAVGAWARSLRGPVQNTVFIIITNMARWTTIVGIGIVLLIIDAVRWRQRIYPLAIGVCLSVTAIYEGLKMIFQRPRPDEALWLLTEHGYSFPSGHSMNGACCYGMMLFLIWRNSENRKLKITMSVVMPIFIALIGFSRIFCGVHYFSDVIGGLCAGTSLLLISTVLIDELLLRNSMKKGESA